MANTISCPSCAAPVFADDFMCPNCDLILDARAASGAYKVKEPTIVRALLSLSQNAGMPAAAERPAYRKTERDLTVKAAAPMDRNTFPKVTADLDIALAPLHAFEAYVVSFLNGVQAVPEIAKSAKLKQVELEAVLRSLVEREVISLEVRAPEAPAAKEAAPAAPAEARPVPAEFVQPTPKREGSGSRKAVASSEGTRTDEYGLPYLHRAGATADPDLLPPPPPADAESDGEPSAPVPPPPLVEPLRPPPPEKAPRARPPTPSRAEPLPPPVAPELLPPVMVTPSLARHAVAPAAKPELRPTSRARRILDQLPSRRPASAPPVPTPPPAPVPAHVAEAPALTIIPVRQALGPQPERAESVLQKAIALEREGDVDGAIQVLERAIARFKKPAPLYNKLAVIVLNQRHDFERAEELLKKALEHEPDNGVFQQNLFKVVALAASTTGKKSKRGGGFFARLRGK